MVGLVYYELERMWKEAVMVYLGIQLEGLIQNSNWTLPEYHSEALLLEPACLVEFF
jgi:hypothetical protein